MSTAAHTPEPLQTVTEFDGRHNFIPILASWECDGNEPYHPLIARVATGHGYADKATGLATAARLVACYNALAGLNPEAVKPALEALEKALERLEEIAHMTELEHNSPCTIREIKECLAALRQPVTQA